MLLHQNFNESNLCENQSEVCAIRAQDQRALGSSAATMTREDGVSERIERRWVGGRDRDLLSSAPRIDTHNPRARRLHSPTSPVQVEARRITCCRWRRRGIQFEDSVAEYCTFISGSCIPSFLPELAPAAPIRRPRFGRIVFGSCRTQAHPAVPQSCMSRAGEERCRDESKVKGAPTTPTRLKPRLPDTINSSLLFFHTQLAFRHFTCEFVTCLLSGSVSALPCGHHARGCARHHRRNMNSFRRATPACLEYNPPRNGTVSV
ncbi:hypothetical protein B0H19DRAFT_531350 [Mycena capillaripes]|nr:hypothetical protein B0H19DRAFT_531350 [Mycena capillaripes]